MSNYEKMILALILLGLASSGYESISSWQGLPTMLWYGLIALLIYRRSPWGGRAAAVSAGCRGLVLLSRAFEASSNTIAYLGSALFLAILAWLFYRASLGLKGSSPQLIRLGVLTAILGVIPSGIQVAYKIYLAPTPSMEPTIKTNDELLVGRVGAVHRGDVVSYIYPVDPSQIFTKRIVGLPGDRIQIRDKQLVVNGQRLDEPYVEHIFRETEEYRDDFPAEMPESFFARIPNVNELRPRVTEMLSHVEGNDLVIPSHAYFVLGDNRDNSLDSRYHGFVPEDAIIGKPRWIIGRENEYFFVQSIPEIHLGQ